MLQHDATCGDALADAAACGAPMLVKWAVHDARTDVIRHRPMEYVTVCPGAKLLHCIKFIEHHVLCRRDKVRENHAAVLVLADLISELESMRPKERLLALVKGVLAGNIFDWGAQACVGLYQDGRILDIYRKAQTDISHRPWRVDHFDKLEKAWFADSGGDSLNQLGVLCA
jgi:hypothetical protein